MYHDVHLGNPELPAIAKCANTARRKVLEGIKCDGLALPVPTNHQKLAMDSNFITVVETQFSLTYRNCDSK